MDITRDKLVKLIIGVILLSILLGLIFSFSSLKDHFEDRKCRYSLQSYATQLEMGLNADLNMIDCPARNIELEQKHIEEQLASEMLRCYSNYNYGKDNLFQGDGIFCAVCGIMDSKEDIEIKDFQKYLMTHYVKGTDKLYFEKLSPFDSSPEDSVIEQAIQEIEQHSTSSTFMIDEDTKYASIFVTIKGKDNIQAHLDRIKRFGMGAAGLGVSALFIKGGLVVMAIPIPGVAQAVGGTVVLIGGTIGVGTITYTLLAEMFAENNNVDWYSDVYIRPYTEKTLKDELKCDYIPVKVTDE